MPDTMQITILDDGMIKVETDKISQANHQTAEALLRNLQSATAGTQSRKHKQGLVGAVAHAWAHATGRSH